MDYPMPHLNFTGDRGGNRGNKDFIKSLFPPRAPVKLSLPQIRNRRSMTTTRTKDERAGAGTSWDLQTLRLFNLRSFAVFLCLTVWATTSVDPPIISNYVWNVP